MATKTIKDMTANEIANLIERALKRAALAFAPGYHGCDSEEREARIQELSAELGVDPNHIKYDGISGAGFTHERREVFGIGVTVYVRIDWDSKDNAVKGKIELSWSSFGSSDPASAVAAAALHLEAAHAACRVQMVLDEILAPLGRRGSLEQDFVAWTQGLAEFQGRVNASRERYFTEEVVSKAASEAAK